jgi:uncharacterized protein YciI
MMELFLNISMRPGKKIMAIAICFLLTLHVNAQLVKPAFDKHLADSLGADEYGMKMYVLVILKTGSNKVQDKQKADSLFLGHMQNINRLVKAGKLVVAGPFETNEKKYEGIFILNVTTIEEAKPLLEMDPAIKAKALDVELFQWYGSAALPMYLKFHEQVKSKDF